MRRLVLGILHKAGKLTNRSQKMLDLFILCKLGASCFADGAGRSAQRKRGLPPSYMLNTVFAQPLLLVVYAIRSSFAVVLVDSTSSTISSPYAEMR